MDRMGMIALLVLVCMVAPVSADTVSDGPILQITSPAFQDKEKIPDMFTCHGSNINPEFNIANIPPKTASLAFVMDDPDAPEGTWVHWVMYDIPPKTEKIAQNSRVGIEGLTDFGIFRYRGPCPDNKRVHRYSFRVYALNDRFELNEGFIKVDLERRMKGKILAQAELIGTYKVADNFNE